ncbi:MFS transporter [Streptosporangium sp. NPDC050855]|uniref:MFS transporter n=1 Tax=Streptosporangium sp. NPDC050855 TaxID=3366194 RepID=UPI0037A5E000
MVSPDTESTRGAGNAGPPRLADGAESPGGAPSAGPAAPATVTGPPGEPAGPAAPAGVVGPAGEAAGPTDPAALGDGGAPGAPGGPDGPADPKDTGEGERPGQGGGSLWSNQDFLRLWTGQTLSQFGSQISYLVIPLIAIVTLGASSTEMGILGALLRLPMLGFLLFGVYIDRMRKRPVLIWSDLGRAAVLALVPLLYVMDSLTLGVLYVVVFFLSLLSVLFQVAYRSYFPLLVPLHQLGEGNGKLQLSESLAQTAGPGVGSALLKVVAAPLLIMIDVLTYLFSAIAIMLIRKREDAPVPDEETAGSVHRAIWAGFKWIMDQPMIRPLAIASGLYSFFVMGAMQSIYVLFLLRGGPNLPPEWVGIVMATGGVGAILGATMSVRTMRGIGIGPTLLWSTVVGNCALLLIPFASGPVWLAAGMLGLSQFIVWASNQVFFVSNMTLVQSITPPHLQARVIGTIYSLGLIPAPLGALGAGLLGETLGLRTAILFAVVAGAILPILLLVFSPIPKVKEIPGT